MIILWGKNLSISLLFFARFLPFRRSTIEIVYCTSYTLFFVVSFNSVKFIVENAYVSLSYTIAHGDIFTFII